MANLIQKKLVTSGFLDHLEKNNKSSRIFETKSLMAIYEQQMFVWHSASYLLTIELSSKNEKSEFKILMLTNPPVFEIDTIQFNNTGSLLALSGKNGVMIFEVPWRYGKFGYTNENKKNLLGRSWNVAEHFFVCSNRINVVQVAWHPGSSSSTHLTVLSTDNYIRIYDVTEPQVPQQVISLGADPKASYLSSESKISFSTCLGENVVSFDFGPPENVCFPQSSRKSDGSKEQLIWPIFVLNGNGDVYLIKAPMKKEKFHPPTRIDDPLAMYPPAEDNYGFDASSILCLHSSPPCLVIATAKNMLYHCIVLENDNSTSKESQFDSNWNSDRVGDQTETALYVFESIELPISVGDDAQSDSYNHSIQLHKDTFPGRYHCIQLSGIHAIAVPFLQTIEDSLREDDINSWLSQHQDKQSVVEHVLCTKPFLETDAVPVIGFDVTVYDAIPILICLFSSWSSTFLPLVCSYHSSTPALLSENEISRKGQENFGVSFEHHIEDALNRSTSSPFLKSYQSSDPSKSSPEQWLDLLHNVTQRFKEDYVQRLSTARAHLENRVKILVQHKDEQLNDINRCIAEEQQLRSKADHLTKKYERAMAAQDNLMSRLENVLQGLQKELPDLSDAEVAMKKNLIAYKEKMKSFEVSLEQIKKKIKYQNERVEDARSENDVHDTMQKLKYMNLGERQLKHVKELLLHEGETVAQLVQTVTTLKKENGL